MLLTGTFRRTLDSKGRIAIPKPLRQALGSDTLFVAPGNDGCLSLYASSAFEELGNRLADHSPTGPEVRAFSRLFYAQAQGVEMDGQGRLRIPVELHELADLKREVVVVGVRDHVEMWDAERWQGYLAEKQSKYDEIAEHAFRTA